MNPQPVWLPWRMVKCFCISCIRCASMKSYSCTTWIMYYTVKKTNIYHSTVYKVLYDQINGNTNFHHLCHNDGQKQTCKLITYRIYANDQSVLLYALLALQRSHKTVHPMSHLKSRFTFPVRLPHNRDEICSVIYQDVICLTLTQASYSSVRGSLPWTEWCNRDSLDTRGQSLEDRLTCLLYSFCSGWALSVKIAEQQDRGERHTNFILCHLNCLWQPLVRVIQNAFCIIFGWMIFYKSQLQIDLLTIHRVLCVWQLIKVNTLGYKLGHLSRCTPPPPQLWSEAVQSQCWCQCWVQ